MIITSLLDLDFYKLTMMQAVFHHFPLIRVRYDFVNRNKEDNLSICYSSVIDEIFQGLNNLKFTTEELNYLKTLSLFKDDFINYLSTFCLCPFDNVFVSKKNKNLSITIQGSWLDTILYETLILSIVSESYYSVMFPGSSSKISQKGIRELKRNIKNLSICHLPIVEFGTRRRYSKYHQENVIYELISNSNIKINGTSNVYSSKRFQIPVKGTQAHEYIQAMQGMDCNLKNSQKLALEIWIQEYRGQLGIALTDTLGIDAFLNDFDLYFAKIYDGLRHDSGDPYVWSNKVLNHYKKLGIDSRTKTLFYSDGLTLKKSEEIYNEYYKFANISFGIGTKLTNNIPGIKPLNIVIKMVECNGQPVAKISDSSGKTICKDRLYLSYLKKVFDIK